MTKRYTPCHQCTAYDHGHSAKPVERCRHKRIEITDIRDQGCESYRQKRRFDSVEDRFKAKGWMK